MLSGLHILAFLNLHSTLENALENFLRLPAVLIDKTRGRAAEELDVQFIGVLLVEVVNHAFDEGGLADSGGSEEENALPRLHLRVEDGDHAGLHQELLGAVMPENRRGFLF